MIVSGLGHSCTENLYQQKTRKHSHTCFVLLEIIAITLTGATRPMNEDANAEQN